MFVNCGWYTEGITGGPTPKGSSTPACIEPGPATTAALCPVVTVYVLQLPKEFFALEETLTLPLDVPDLINEEQHHLCVSSLLA